MNELIVSPSDVSTQAMVFNPDVIAHMQSMAEAMAAARVTVPKHLAGSPGDCLAVVMQAAQWRMNPFAVAQKTHLVNGALGYEAQLVNAVVCASGAIKGRFHYEYRGEGASIECRVGAVLAGEGGMTWGEWLSAASVQTKNSPLWKSNPKQQLGYLQVKNWARLYAPGAILGVYSTDELAERPPERVVSATVVEESPAPPASRTEGIKAKLRSKRQAVADDQPGAETVTLADVLARIDEATTEKGMKSVGELAASLADPAEKATARAAFAAKLAVMREAGAGPQTDPDEEVGTAEGEHEQDAAE